MMALTRINNNITALNALRSYSVTAEDLRTSLERLSSGLRINRAADDAAGLTIAENLRLQVTGINQAVENSSDAINLVNTAEGALSETTARLQRIRTLALQAANLGANDSVTLQAIQQEIDSSIQEISRIANDTQFASQHLLNGEKNNSVSIVAGDSLGIRTNPESYSSTLSTGKHHLKITRTVAGSETVHNGADGVNNSGMSAFAGSTFETGTYDVVVSNVVAAQARVVSTGGSITTDGTSQANGTDALDGLQFDGYSVDQNDVLRFTVVESDGTSTAVNVAVGAANTIDDVVAAINSAIGSDSASYDASTGQFVLTAASAGANSSLSITLAIDEEGGGVPYEKILDNSVRTAGADNTATLSIGGGPSQMVAAGQTVTVYGPAPTQTGIPPAQITFTLGSALAAGTDVLSLVQSEYTGQLDGGTEVAFRNGAQDVRFRSGSENGSTAGEGVTLDFDAAINLGGTSRTIVLSAVNNSMNFQIGANSGQNVSVAFGDMRADKLGFLDQVQPNGNARVVSGIDVTSLTGANEALEIIDEAIRQVDTQRSSLGAFTNRLEATIANLGVASENLAAAESRIRDADIAFETTRMTRNQILLQAGTAVLTQANAASQNVLALLQK